jgi:membrane-bound serine protease (ClpP class)
MYTEQGRRFRVFGFLLLWVLGLVLSMAGPVHAQEGRDAVHIMEIRGIINPPVAEYLKRALQDAAEQEARLVVIQMDTPGGLESSMREMTQALLASPVPVAIFVAPPGAHAASAGLFILQAGHLAAMAPSTNTGSAHPVGLGGEEQDEVMTAKVVHDAAATIRSLAEVRGRNAEWAEQAVRESVSVTEREALELNVIDLVARDLDDLLQQVDGRTVETVAGEFVLSVADASRYDAQMSFAERLLHVISNPNIAFILLSVGSIGIIAELYNPGALVPGITGVISLLFAFFALGNLPTNWAGVAFILLAVVLLVAELNTDATGVLSTGAVVAFLLGGLMLFRPLQPGSPALPDLSVNPWLIGGSTALMAAFVLLVVTQVATSRRSPLRTGSEQYVGQLATVHQDLDPQGRVRFESQLWFARVSSEQVVASGQTVRIVGMEGLTLLVEPVAGSPEGDRSATELPAAESPAPERPAGEPTEQGAS